MAAAVLEWLRDENGDWATPKDRRCEFVLLVGFVVGFVAHAHFSVGLPAPDERPIVTLLGVLCGYWYAAYGRDRIVEYAPENVWSYVSLVVGGFGLSLLELVHVATPVVAFVVAAAGTALLIYATRLVSPFHDGLQPAKRGVEPPSAESA